MTTAAWIKMRTNLWDDPRVSRICDLTGAAEATVVGSLYWLWATADEHSVDGILHGQSLASIDRKTKVKGLGAALADVGWIMDTPEGVRIPRFDEHNGASAKRRSLDAQGKGGRRHAVVEMSASDADKVTTKSGSVADKVTTKCGRDAVLEKEREEEKKKDPPPSADPPARGVKSRGLKNCPGDFLVTGQLQHWARDNAPLVDIRAETAIFRSTERKTAITDWPKAWQAWMLREQKRLIERARPAAGESTFRREKRERAEELSAGLVSVKPPGYRPTLTVLEGVERAAIAER